MKPVLIFLVAAVFLCYAGVEAVNQCYYCWGACDNPYRIQNCTDLGSGPFKCYSEKYTSGPSQGEFKSCFRETAALKELCENNNKQSGSWCRICDSELCNSGEIFSASVLLLSSLAFFLARIM